VNCSGGKKTPGVRWADKNNDLRGVIVVDHQNTSYFLAYVIYQYPSVSVTNVRHHDLLSSQIVRWEKTFVNPERPEYYYLFVGSYHISYKFELKAMLLDRNFLCLCSRIICF